MYSKARWLILFSAAVAIMSLYINMIVFAPILGNIAGSLDVDMGTATNLMMGFVLSVACVLIWGGVVCDKFGITAAFILGLLCTTIPATLMPLLGQSFSAVFVARLIQGASVGFIFATIGPILALWFPPKEQGLAAGVLFGSISLGSTIGVVASPVLLEVLGSWEITVAVMSIPGWAGIVMAYLFTRQTPSPEVIEALQAGTASGKNDLTVKQALALPKTVIVTAVIVCNAWAMYCMYNLVPPFLAAPAPMGVGLPPVSAGNLSLALTSVGIIAPFVGGIFFDRIVKGNPKPAVIIGFALTGLFTYVISLPSIFGNMPALIVCLMLAGWGIPFMGSSLSAFIATSYPPDMVGRMMGFCFGVGTLGGALGLYLGGRSIGSTGNFVIALTMISGAALVGIILMLPLKGKQTAKIPAGAEISRIS
jgi:predicted MFS family arabinose efflux permease